MIFYQEYHRAAREQVTVEFEEFYPPLNKWLHLHIYPYPGGLSVYFQDVSERKQAEEELSRYRSRLEELVKERTAELQATNDQLQREITRRRRAEVGLLHYAERLKILQDIDRSILAAQSREAIAQAALHNIRRLVPCRLAYVAEFDFYGQQAMILATHLNNEVKSEAVNLPLAIFGLENEFSWNTVRVVEEIDKLPEPPAAAILFLEEEVRSYVDVPLLAADQLIGVLTLASGRTAAFTAEHVAVAREVATQLALAIQQARLHEQVQQYAMELEQRVSERTSALQEVVSEMESFSYTVSHDLRAPLRAMQGFADALLEDYSDQLDETGRDYGRRIAAAAQRMDNLIQDLLTYGRLSRARLPRERVSLEVVAAEAIAQLETEIRERQAEISLLTHLPEVLGHRATLIQVTANLLSNAIKFVPPGVTPRVCLSAETRQGRVRLWVEDNGIGVAPEHRERIFRIFERLHSFETYPGTGIGLAFVRKGISRMGGSAGLEPAPEQGSRFWFELPGVAEPAAPA
jgi:signal transduction histidine kinase